VALNGLMLLLIASITSLVIIVGLSYNFETGFWYDTPYTSSSYYTFHPHPDDTCEDLQSKLDLFHPKGTNPIRFEVMKAMFKADCEVIIR